MMFIVSLKWQIRDAESETVTIDRDRRLHYRGIAVPLRGSRTRAISLWMMITGLPTARPNGISEEVLLIK